MTKWSVHRWKCRNNYRDGCRPVWMASPPDGEGISLEFATWANAMDFVNRELAGELAK